MQGATKLREQEDSYLGKQNQANNSTAWRKWAEVGNSEWEMNEKNWKQEIIEHEKKKVNGQLIQVEAKGENGSNASKCWPKRRKRKS